jgi:Flp pilus assembly pilin Flp
MKLTSWLLRVLSNEDNSTDLIEYVLIASVLLCGVLAVCGAVTSQIIGEFSSIASHMQVSAVAR